MTDKQIMIDGVDVSWCEHYTGNIGYLTNKNWTCRAKIQGTKCEDCPDCYYKNWKRKEQEYEELKKEHYELTEEVSIDRALFAEIDQLKAELEEYKNVVNKLAGMQVILTNENGVPQLYDNVKDLRLKKLSQTITEIEEYLKPYLFRGGVEPQWVEWQMAQREKEKMAKDILKILQKYKVVLK